METLAGRPAPLEADDRELVERSRARDAGAFRELIDRHRDRAYTLALRIVREPSDAEEVTQDAFVRAWIALPAFRGESRFSTWLFRIVARRSFDRAATLRRRRGREAPIESLAEDPAEPGMEAKDALRARLLARLIDRLSDAQRAVVTLFYYEDRSVEEVAMTLGLPPGTVKTHLSRARAALRAAWVEDAGRTAE